jgi:hypothetical protein
MTWMTEKLECIPQQGQSFVFVMMSRLALVPTKPPAIGSE